MGVWFLLTFCFHKTRWSKFTCKVITFHTLEWITFFLIRYVRPYDGFFFHFTVYNKKPVPSLSDHVYRLDRISSRSERYKRLIKANIKTVMDLLTLNAINPERLKEVIINLFSHKFMSHCMLMVTSSNAKAYYEYQQQVEVTR